MFTSVLGAFGGRRKIFITVSSSQSDYNLYIEAGSPIDPVDLEVTIDSAVVLSGSTTTLSGFKTGIGWTPYCRLTLINNGSIIGDGGAAGDGADHSYISQGDCTGVTGATDGEDGGDALDIEFDIIIDNTNGNIFGGGGGTGGGPGGSIDVQVAQAGGGGGGGAGGGAAGDIGIASNATNTYNGCPGNAGTSGPSGIGGELGRGGSFLACGSLPTGIFGGDYGEDGDTISSGICTGTWGDPGLAGKAVELNGNIVTWLGGNNSTQVKGVVT